MIKKRKNNIAILIVSLGFFALPIFASASVVINEIAWMGMLPKNGETTQAAANNEWIELYSSSGANLDGWILKTADDAMTINLSGSISAGGYFLIERTDDDTVPNVAADLAVPFGSGLSNAGEILILINSSGAEENRVDALTGWPAGDNSTKETMQKLESGWTTATGTPKAPNYEVMPPPPPPNPPPQSPPAPSPSPVPVPIPPPPQVANSIEVTQSADLPAEASAQAGSPTDIPDSTASQSQMGEQADKQVAAVSISFFSKSSTMWLLAALGVGLLATLGFLASRKTQ